MGLLMGLEPQRELELELVLALAQELVRSAKVPGCSQVAIGHDTLRGRLVQVQQ